jgi:peptidyl-prolyl cis-trans isomerase A (cyclophilin A)
MLMLVLGCRPAVDVGPSKQPGPGGREVFVETRSVPLEKPLGTVAVAPGDPLAGRFSLAEATRDLDGEGVASAELHTSMGRIDCELFEDRAPITVANFVGLARGLRPWRSENGWVKQPFFDGTFFHRVVPGFVIQAGSRPDLVDGGPGYAIPDEVWQGSRHDQAGLLCMANEGPDTGGSQFFILAGDGASQLDGSYTVFGSCFQTDVVDRISRVKAFGEKPAEPVRLERVVILRVPRW